MGLGPEMFDDLEAGGPWANGPALPSLDGPRLQAFPASRARLRALQACLADAPDYFLRTEDALPAEGAAESLLAETEADALRRVFVLCRRGGDEAVVGVLDLYLHQPEPGFAHVGLLLFRESCQGVGYGREAAASLERALGQAGFTTVRASVGDENPGALAFWERVGFEHAGRLADGVTVLEKRIGPGTRQPG